MALTEEQAQEVLSRLQSGDRWAVVVRELSLSREDRRQLNTQYRSGFREARSNPSDLTELTTDQLDRIIAMKESRVVALNESIQKLQSERDQR